MGKHTRLMRRGNRWYVRRRVPVDVVEVLKKSDIWRSLKTSDYREAVRRKPIVEAEIEAEFEAARRRNSEWRPVTEFDLKRVALAWLTEQERKDERSLINDPVTADRYCEVMLDCHKDEDDLKHPDTDVRAQLKAEAQKLADQHGIDLEPEGDSHKTLTELLRRARLDNVRRFRRKLDSNFAWISDPLFANDGRYSDKPATRPSGPSLTAIFEKWAEERKPPQKTLIEWRASVRRFADVSGDLPIDAITRQHVREYKDNLLKLPNAIPHDLRSCTVAEIINATHNKDGSRLAPQTVNKQITAIAAILSWSMKNGYRDDNPASGMSVAVGGNSDQGRLPYDLDDMKLTFGGLGTWKHSRPARFWLPLLAAFTGARVEELGQLRIEDVRRRDGIDFIDLNSEGGKSLKTRASKREVPIHRELIALGFLDFVEQRRTEGGERLFADLKYDTVGKLTGHFSKWYSRYSRGLGITDRRKVFHSFRHGFKEACRAGGIPEEIHDALTGHAGGGVGRRYGAVPLKTKADAIMKIHYRGLDLKYLHVDA